MRFVPIKTVEQQCARALLKTRDLLVRQRTQLANAMRGHLYEMGLINSKGAAGMAALLERIEAAEEAIPIALLVSLEPLARQWRALQMEIGRLDKQIAAQVRQDKAARRLMAAPGVSQFSSGRDFAAWLGLTRKNNDTGGKASLTGKISRAGDEGVRKLLVLGASSHLRCVRAKPDAGSPWIRGVLARRPVKVAVVAQASKTARILWAMLRSGQEYRAPAAA
jgi:transposase